MPIINYDFDTLRSRDIITIEFTSSESEGPLSIPLHQVSSIKRMETPRPNSCRILWNSKELHFAASNGASADEWFELLCHAKRKLMVSGKNDL